MLKRLMSSEFNRNALKLMTGATMAQAIPVAIAPILTRIYSPEDFGILALFISIVSIFGAIANGRYELAIVLPKKDEDAINIAALSVLISTILSTFLFLIIFLFSSHIALLLGNKGIEPYLYFIPLSVLFIGIFNVLNYLNTRFKTFGLIAKVNVVKSMILAISQLTFGFLKLGSGGLIAGQILSYLMANRGLAKDIFKDKGILKYVRRERMLMLSKRYNNFPKYTLWATLSNSLSLQSINIFISIMFSTTTLGYFSIVQRVLSLPSTLISRTFGQVFYEKSNNEKQKYGHAKHTFKSTFIKLLIISLLIYAPLFFLVEDIFALVFGEEWRIAGKYAKGLMPLVFVRFIASPLTLINIVFEKQKNDLVWQISLLIFSFLSYILSYFLGLNIMNFLYLYSSMLIILYLLIIIITYNVSKKQ